MKKVTNDTYQKRDVKINIELPEETDCKAQMELEQRLKEVYLRKIELGSIQVGETAVQCTPPVAGAK